MSQWLHDTTKKKKHKIKQNKANRNTTKNDVKQNKNEQNKKSLEFSYHRNECQIEWCPLINFVFIDSQQDQRKKSSINKTK